MVTTEVRPHAKQIQSNLASCPTKVASCPPVSVTVAGHCVHLHGLAVKQYEVRITTRNTVGKSITQYLLLFDTRITH